jgi:tol-pal system protein YbgF
MFMPDIMRRQLLKPTILLAVLFLGVGSAALAQGVAVPTTEQMRNVERRVSTLESQMRAVQREVFPGGDKRFFAADAPAPPPPAEAAPPAGDPMIELTMRLEAIESQQRSLTGQIEELQFRLRQVETAFEKARGDTEFRLNALEGGRPAATAPAPQSAEAPPAAAAAPAPAPAGPAPATPARPAATPEEAYQAAYAFYKARDWPRASAELAGFAAANPKSPRASNAQYWAGRAEMEQGRHAEAAKLFLSGYKTWPQGAMAASSLLWLGKALIAMQQPKASCDALNQLRTAYPDRLTGTLATEAQAARAQAKCGP